MATTSEYLTSLQNDLATLKTNVASKGVEVSDSDNFTTLAEKVSEIQTGGGASDIYKVSSITERDNLTGLNEGDICMVYQNAISNMTEETQTSSITFPSQVVLPEAFSDFAMVRLNAVEGQSGYADINGDLSSNSFRCTIMTDNNYLNIEYSSEDGITYNRTDSNDETIDLGIIVGVEMEWNDNIGYFMQVGTIDFQGLFTYKDNTWEYTNIGIKNIASSLISGNKAYTNNGVITGTLGTSITKADLLTLNDLLINQESITMPENCTNYFQNDNNIENLYSSVVMNMSNVTNMSRMFYNCQNLKYISTETWDTSKVTDMSNMFYQNYKLEDINLKNWDTSSLTTTYMMFRSCNNLKNVDISNWDLTKMQTMGSMFQNCSQNLTELVVKDKVATNLTNVSSMFNGCNKLQKVDLSGWTTTNINDITFLFYNCRNLKEINLAGWTTENVTNLADLFYNCSSLEKVDIRDFTFANVTKYSQAINGMNTSCLIIVKDETEKNWLQTTFSSLTNVQTIEEYEASL